MKYKLINKTTKEEYICEKVVIDGWDYYVSNAYGNPAIATNYPYHDILNIPKVVDEVEILVNKLDTPENLDQFSFDKGFIDGYNKSQETHPFSMEDVQFMLSEAFKASQEGYQITSDEIIQLWKEQRPKTLYYV